MDDLLRRVRLARGIILNAISHSIQFSQGQVMRACIEPKKISESVRLLLEEAAKATTLLSYC